MTRDRFDDEGLGTILESMPDALVVVDPQGTIRYANQAIVAMSGIARESLVGSTVDVLVPERLSDRHEAHRRDYTTSGQPSRPMGTGLDIRLRCADGHELAVDIALSPLRLSDVTYTVATVRDVTERKREHARAEAINKVTGAILEGSPVPVVIGSIAARGRELVEGALASVCVPHDDPRFLRVAVADGREAESLSGAIYEAVGSVAGEALRSLRPVLLEEPPAGRGVHHPSIGAGAAGPAVVLPMAAGERRLGALIVSNPAGGRRFTDEDLLLLKAFAGSAAVAMEYGRVRGELQRLAVLEDRERIAKELHDDVIQSLFAEGMALQATEAVVGDPEAVRVRLRTAVEHIDRVIRDLRTYIFELRPRAGHERELSVALHELASSVGEGSPVPIQVAVDPSSAAALATRTQQVLQAAREALSNAVRHSGADHIAVSLHREQGGHVLEVSDNGKGFDVSGPASSGNGIPNLRMRAAALGGSLSIDSEPGRGTTVRVIVPS